MARKSQDLDKKLILIGQSLIQEVGVSQLSMREVAKIAEVNLGMLSYHFNGKEDFVLKCLNALYTPFLEDLKSIDISSEKTDSFLEFLMKLAFFSRDNRKLILIIIKDIISQDRTTISFIIEHFSEHFRIIQKSLNHFLGLQDSDREKQKLAFQLFVSLIGFPSLLNGVVEICQSSTERETDEQLAKRVNKAKQILLNF